MLNNGRKSIGITLENLRRCRGIKQQLSQPVRQVDDNRTRRNNGTSYQKLEEERRERGRLVSKHIGYIPRDLSRDNWQICRAEVNGSGNERSLETRQKGRKIVLVVLLSSLLNFKFSTERPRLHLLLLSLLRVEPRPSRSGIREPGFCDSKTTTLTKRTRPLCADPLPSPPTSPFFLPFSLATTLQGSQLVSVFEDPSVSGRKPVQKPRELRKPILIQSIEDAYSK